MAVIKNNKKRIVTIKNPSSDKLSLLLSAALALPGIAQANDVGLRAEKVKLDYNHANYSESDDRMKASVDQLAISAPIASSFELKVSAIQDVTSGASPVLYLADPGEKPISILQAGASIQDTRNVFDVGVGFYGEKNYVAAKIGNSSEDDYEANFASVDYVHYLNNKNTSLIFGYAQSNDEFWNVYFPVGSSNFDPFLDPKVVKKRDSQDVQFAIDQVLDKNSRLLISLTIKNSSGNLSDPYKKVYVQGAEANPLFSTPSLYPGSPEALENAIMNDPDYAQGVSEILRKDVFGIFNDKRPTDRTQNILLARYSRYIAMADAAIHADYRFSDDDWNATSHTIEAKWSQSLPKGYILSPGIRYYAQNNADFYNIVFANQGAALANFQNTNHSSDYRLAGFGAISYKLALDKTYMEKLSLRVSYELYHREHSLALYDTSKGDEVDDYQAQLLSISIGYLFK